MKSRYMVFVYTNFMQNLCYVSGIYYDKVSVDEAMSFINFTQFDPKKPYLEATKDEGYELANIKNWVWQFRNDTEGRYFLTKVGVSSGEPFVFRGHNEDTDVTEGDNIPNIV